MIIKVFTCQNINMLLYSESIIYSFTALVDRKCVRSGDVVLSDLLVEFLL